MYYVYVLYSAEYRKIYIGFTPDLIKRLASHNHPMSKGYTGRYRPWEILYYEEYQTKKDALRRERQLKTSRGREFIKTLLPG